MKRVRLRVSSRPGSIAATVASICGLVSLLVVLGFVLHAFKRMADDGGSTLPSLGTASMRDVTWSDLLVRLTKDGPVIDGEARTLLNSESLAAWRKKRGESAPGRARVFIALQEDSAAGDIAEVITRLQKAGFTDFALIRER